MTRLSTMMRNVGDQASLFVDNRIVNPIKNIPTSVGELASGIKEAISQDKTRAQRIEAIKRSAVGGLQTLGALSPGPDDLLFGAYEAVKAKLANKNPVKGFTGEEQTGLGDATGVKVLNRLELPILVAAGAIKAKNMDAIDRSGAIDALKRYNKNVTSNNLDYFVNGLKKDESYLRELAGDYIDKRFAKKAPIQNVVDELTNRVELEGYRKVAPETPISLEIPNLLKKKAEGLTPEVNPLIQEAKKYKSAEEFVKAQPVKTEELVGAMGHRPTKTGATVDNISQEASEMGIPDFYEHPEWYHYGGKEYDESVNVLMKLRGKPNSKVTIYRASPYSELRTGDWITLSKEKARLESYAENVPIQKFTVSARDVEFAGDDITEFGYWGHSTKEQKQLTDIYNQAHKK